MSLKPDPASPAKQRIKMMYRAQHAIWLWLGVAAVISTVAWFVDPQGEASRSAIGRELDHGLDDAWHLLLGLGGAIIIYGIWRLRTRAEVIGHLFVGMAVLINAFAAVIVVGWTSTVFILVGIGVASGFRIWFLIQKVS